jgi:hypothetical protein
MNQMIAPVLNGKKAGRQWGDFQTPPELAEKVCHYLAEQGISPHVIVEPTCGVGNFLLAALKAFPTIELAYGVEIQGMYIAQLELALDQWKAESGSPVSVILQQDDIFHHRFPAEVLAADDVLIVGNPPWVTNAEVGASNGHNLPTKRNLKQLKGLDALTGRSNFDLAESILLRLLTLFSGRRGTLAMLCKQSVARNLVELLPAKPFAVSQIELLVIDAGIAFDASVAAALLVMRLGGSQQARTGRMAYLDRPAQTLRTFGWVEGQFVANVDMYQTSTTLEGTFPFTWRQGIKHDCASVMELTCRQGVWVNGNGMLAEVENDWVYRLMKGSDLRHFWAKEARKRVIVSQRQLNDDTYHLQVVAPKLWQYLTANKDYFDRRKSRIYEGKPPFALFGVGDYSFKPYKVAISGLHKKPIFSLILPVEGRPVLLDDTCYFVGFERFRDALFTASLLNSPTVQQFLEAIVFTDGKRPYTKQALKRIGLAKVAGRYSFDDLRHFWDKWGYQPAEAVTAEDYEAFRNALLPGKEEAAAQQLRLEL